MRGLDLGPGPVESAALAMGSRDIEIVGNLDMRRGVTVLGYGCPGAIAIEHSLAELL